MAVHDVAPAGADDALLTIDELALATDMTVRTTRYYASLGLLPPPLRRGRMAYYGRVHLARLQLVRALQDHGFTLAAIERYLADVPLESTAEELSVHRALLTAWKPSQWEDVSRRELDERAGRRLTQADVDWLATAGALRRGGAGGYQVLPLLRLAVQLREVDMPIEAITEANQAVNQHMAELADELTRILRSRVLTRYEHAGLSADEADELQRTLASLRTLTLEAIVESFQRAANQVARKSLSVPES